MTISILKTTRNHLPLIGLLGVQLLIGIMLIPLNNFSGIYFNEALAYPMRQVAQVIALGQIIGMAASVVSGSLSDQWGHKWILLIGVSSIAIGSILYIVNAPWLVIILWCVASAGMGISAVSSQGYLTLVSSAGLLGISSALYNWGYTIGGAIGIPIATFILGEDNFSMLGFSLIALGLLTVSIASLLPVLRSKLPEQKQPSVGIQGGYGVLLRRPIIILIMLRFLPTCYYGVMTLLPLLIKQQSNSNTAVAWYVVTSSIFASLTQLLAGRTADRYGVRLPTQVAFSFILVAIAGTIFTAPSIWGLYIFGGLGIGAAWALSTLLPGLVTTAAEPEIHGRMFGMLHLVWTMAMAIGTLLGGNLLEVDIRLPFIIVGVLNIIALILTIPFFRLTTAQTATTSKYR